MSDWYWYCAVKEHCHWLHQQGLPGPIIISGYEMTMPCIPMLGYFRLANDNA